MVTKISRLKNFGIFHDFSWESALPEFKRFNLIYGWNRNGKTTTSRIFASCEKKCCYDEVKFKQYPEMGEFELKADENITIKNTDVSTNTLPIRVFNQDFIDENISFNPQNSSKPIIYVSEEDIESKKQLEVLKTNSGPLALTYQVFKTKRESAEKIEDNFRISVAQTITQLLTDKKSHDQYYSYDKTKVKTQIDQIGIDNIIDRKLSDKNKIEYELISKGEVGGEQNLIPTYQLAISFDGGEIRSFDELFNSVKDLLNKKIVSEILDKLKNDQDLNNWVKQGFDLHKSKSEKDKCLFCGNTITNGFLNSLSKHFSKDYEHLQSVIILLKNTILMTKKTEITAENNSLYPNLRQEYTAKATALNILIVKINAWLDDLVTKLDKKHNNPLLTISNPESPEDLLTTYNKTIHEINKIISDHNMRIQNHRTEVSAAKEKLELHSIAVALVDQNYTNIYKELENLGVNERVALAAVSQNDSDIVELEKKTSNIGKAISKINRHLVEFFGREEIKLELDGDKKGYLIKRGEQLAKNLSEGEKTAIAFSYFIAKTGEGGFDKSKGIFFIDDPISSFDSNFIYHCFSLIKNHFNEVGQLFVSTHNFQLFNLIKDWLQRKNKNTEEDNQTRKIEGKPEKLTSCEFYMIKTSTSLDKRSSQIVTLDKTLRDYKSEYAFLFSLLKEFNKKIEEPEFEELYNIANLGRRFFDIFADFKIPTNNSDPDSKIKILVNEINKSKTDEEKINSVSCDKIFWLINGFSHNSDPTSTIEHKDKSECKEAIRLLLMIVKESDPKHYEILEKN